MYKTETGISLVVQWLRLHTSTAGALGFLPGQETKIPQATWYGKKIKQTNKQQKQTHRQRNKIYGCQVGHGPGEGWTWNLGLVDTNYYI